MLSVKIIVQYYFTAFYEGILSHQKMFWYFNERVINIFNMRTNVSIDTKSYTCILFMYDIEYLFDACRNARDGIVLMAH